MSIREIENGIKAAEEYKSLTERFETIRDSIRSAWDNTTILQADVRESLYMKMTVLRELERSFVNDIKTGQMAEVAENAKRTRTARKA